MDRLLVRFRDRGVLVVFAVAVLGVFALDGLPGRAKIACSSPAWAIPTWPCTSRPVSPRSRIAWPARWSSSGSRKTTQRPVRPRCGERRSPRRLPQARISISMRRSTGGRRCGRRLAALAVGLLAAGLTVADAAAARTALARLAFPLGTADWPQRTHLGLRQPVKPIVVVRGQPLEVEVIDTAGCPVAARLPHPLSSSRMPKERTREETEPMQFLGKAMVARRENVSSPLEFRFTGGDDRNMNWIQVQVIDPPEPPAVCSLTLTVTPPGYTNWPAEEREATSPRPLLAGSHVQLAGKTTKRLKPASKLRFDDGRVLPIEIDGDGMTFHVGRPSRRPSTEPPHELIVEKSTGYTFRLIDVDGVEGGGDESWQFRVLTDAPPSAVIEQPAGDLFVTERAVVNFRVRARDDMALRQVVLVLSPSDAKAAKEKTLPLFNGPDKPPPSSVSAFDAGTTGEPDDDRPHRGTVRIPACPRHAIDLLCDGHRLSTADRPQRSAGIDRHHARPIAGADGRAAEPDPGGVGPRAATPARRPQPGPQRWRSGCTRPRAWSRPTSIACRPRSSTSARSCGA